MTANILLINNGRILAEGDVHHIRDLIDEHPHTVYVRAADPRRLAREFLAHDDVRSLRFEPDAVVVETGKPDRVLRAADRHGRDAASSAPSTRSRRRTTTCRPSSSTWSNDARAPGHVDECRTTPPRRARPPGFVASSLRIFDLSLGEMLWSRRTIFMALVVGAPVLIALSCGCWSGSGRRSSTSREAAAAARSG